MANSKKLIVPVVALMLCAVAVIGVGYAYQGTYTDDGASKDMEVHWVQVGADAPISIDTSTYMIDVDTATQWNTGRTELETTYDFAETQKHGGVVSPDGSTITFANIEIAKLNFTEDSNTKTGATRTLAIGFGADKEAEITVDNVTIKFTTTPPTTFTAGTPVSICVDIVINKAALTDGGAGVSTVSTPAFVLNVLAEVTEA